MFQPLVFFIGLRYAYSQKSDSFGRFVSWLSTIGILLGSLGLIVVTSVMNGFVDDMQNKILQYLPQAQITTTQNRLQPSQISLDSLPNLKGVKQISPLVTGEVVLQGPSSISMATMMGINPTQQDPIADRLYIGDLKELTAGEYKVIIGNRLASQLGVNIGDNIRLMTTQASQITPLGRMPSQRLFKVAGIFSAVRDIEQTLIYTSIEDAARLLKYPQGTITSWRLFLDDPLNIDDIASTQLPNNLVFKDWRLMRGELFQAVKMEQNIMSLLISLIVIVAAFNIITSLSLLVMEKQNEIAILKTQGLNSRSVMLIFMIQGASSGIIGSVLGCGLGWLISLYLNQITSFFGITLTGMNIPSLVNNHQVIIIFISLLTLSICSTLYPAYRAAKVHPAKALRYE